MSVSSAEHYELFRNKYVLFCGCSIIRSVYKDFCRFLQTDVKLTDRDLRATGVFTVCNVLLDGGAYDGLRNHPLYYEKRAYFTTNHLVKYVFFTRCLNDRVKELIKEIDNDPVKPDVFVLNLGLWDLSVYDGTVTELEYKKNFEEVFTLFRKVLPKETIIL
ncbi:unnamed protein product [Didymodactylos carnosus]|uniref:Uncharacterized protein n=1 Tax=Didymodactylos carnosus TaxID=1234261 RepID=A0A8S2V344_9BILA|nr:unnamed protein product [Didymodactylos carnosus]CAF4376867.1 unnamed protein product [Didymodactylos carnosus]